MEKFGWRGLQAEGGSFNIVRACEVRRRSIPVRDVSVLNSEEGVMFSF